LAIGIGYWVLDIGGKEHELPLPSGRGEGVYLDFWALAHFYFGAKPPIFLSP